MMQYVREFRLIPVVLLATASLLGLKVTGLVLDGGYTFRPSTAMPERLVVERAALAPAPGSAASDVTTGARLSWAQDMFNFPKAVDASGKGPPPPIRTPDVSSDNALTTGSVQEKKEEKPNEQAKKPPAPATPPPQPGGTLVPLDAGRLPAGERAILERLGERRQELEARARELEIRENMLKSAEKRLEDRGTELKDMETRLGGSAQKREEASAVQIKSLVIMYENMKAKDAARIFDRLEMRVLLEVVSQINPRRMADIMAQMQPETAERLTVEMANRATSPEKTLAGNDLPKIEGKPSPPPAAPGQAASGSR
jgi:flagellar motility protein MotE (MotC chaperone)